VRLRFGDCVLDRPARELRRGGVPCRLSPKGLQFLELVLDARPRALTKGEIHEKVWPGTFVSDSSLARLASEVRAAIGDDARHPRLLQTVHGHGYRFSGTATVEPPPASPAAVAGCRLLWGDRQIPLLDGENVLGRGAEASIRIDLGRVSRLHARIRVEGGRVLLEDLGSKNGTFLGGERVVAPAELADGDEVAIGSVVLLFRAAGSEATTETGTIR
jgi:DNA-binding winged helix-turn-helix (wHTH) protein